jgi:NDP-hexose-3-ketoreductase
MKINIGIIGCAKIAERNMIPAIQDLVDLYNIVGIASREKDKAEKFGKQFNIPAVVGYENLLNNPQLEAVYIPLPNAMHYEWIEKALTRKLNVLVEKSMACAFNDVERLNILARKNDLALVENFQFRFHHQLHYITGLLNAGEIGELRCIRSSFGFPPFADINNIRYKNELGGGALLDAGAYPLKIVQLFMGQEISVKAANLYYDKTRNVDLWGGAYLNQKNGNMFAEIAFGFDHFYQCNIELWGSKGKIYTNRIFTAQPSHQPEIIIENNSRKETIILNPDHHFKNMLTHFYNLSVTKKDLEQEYVQNINQARLLHELKNKADGK